MAFYMILLALLLPPSTAKEGEECANAGAGLGGCKFPGEGGGALEEYVTRHRRAVEDLMQHRDPGVGFVVMQPSGGGLGNRELVSVAGLAVAIATRRVALVDWYGVTKEDISDIEEVYESPRGLKLSFPSVQQIWPEWPGWRDEKLIIFDSTNVYDERWGAEELVCSELKGPAVIRIITEQYVTSLIEHNPLLGSVLEALGPGLYKQLSSLYLRPISIISTRVEEISREKFTGKYVIGIQIRRARDSGHFFLWEDQHLFWECAILTARRQTAKNPNQPLAFFIATDSEPVREEAITALAPYEVLIVPMDTRQPDTRGQEGWQNAMVDNYLLSLCQDLIVSGGSTFGYVAHGRSDVIPLVVSGIHHRCMRPVTAEPYNIAHLAIKHVSCFDSSSMLNSKTDMICSSVNSVHSCASHSSEKMAKMHQASKTPHFSLGSSENKPKAYNDVVREIKVRKGLQNSIKLLETALSSPQLDQSKLFSKAAYEAGEDDMVAAKGFFGLAASYFLSAAKGGQDSNSNLHQAMKSLFAGLRLSPYQIEANMLMGNMMELWGGTPRRHVAAQFYKRAAWCLESAIFDDDTYGDWASGCRLVNDLVQFAPPSVSLDALLVTTYMSLQRALNESGREREAVYLSDLMRDEFEQHLLASLRGKARILGREIVLMLRAAATPDGQKAKFFLPELPV